MQRPTLSIAHRRVVRFATAFAVAGLALTLQSSASACSNQVRVSHAGQQSAAMAMQQRPAPAASDRAADRHAAAAMQQREPAGAHRAASPGSYAMQQRGVTSL